LQSMVISQPCPRTTHSQAAPLVPYIIYIYCKLEFNS
jgi:hypothetical protein